MQDDLITVASDIPNQPDEIERPPQQPFPPKKNKLLELELGLGEATPALVPK